MLERLNDYDWKEAFSYANFSIEDVEEVIKDDEGCNDGPNWISFGRLKDGRYYFLSAGCDYTGWDCQAGGESFEYPTKEEAIRFGMGDEDRRRLGLELNDPRHEPTISDID